MSLPSQPGPLPGSAALVLRAVAAQQCTERRHGLHDTARSPSASPGSFLHLPSPRNSSVPEEELDDPNDSVVCKN